MLAHNLNNNREKPLFLIDGSGFIFRAYYALPPMTKSDGTPVNAVYGFTNMLVKLIIDMNIHNIAVIFDAKRENFRNKIYPEYKANRQETPEDLIPQFELIRKASDAFGLPPIEQEGYEADDIIATYAKIAKKQGKEVVIVSSDKDLMQLVEDGIKMFDPIKYRYLTEEDVIKKFGVPANKVVDVQALAGDSIDNIPGVPGIGVKTAAQLINEYGSLEELLARAEEIKQPKRRETLINNKEKALISKKLVELNKEVKVPFSIDELDDHNMDKDKLIEFLKEQEFKTIVNRLEFSLNKLEKKQQKKTKYELINKIEQLKTWLNEIEKVGYVAIDTETTSLTPAKAKLVGISMAISNGYACYIPLGHASSSGAMTSFDFDDNQKDSKNQIEQLPVVEVMRLLKPILEDSSILKIGHNIKYDIQIFLPFGIELAPVTDTMLMSYVLDSTEHKHSMDALAEQLLGKNTIKYSDICGKGKNQISFDEVDIKDALNYAAEDADITLQLYNILNQRIFDEKCKNIYETLERPLINVIAHMEYEGIRVNPTILKKLSHEFLLEIHELEQEIHNIANIQFNIGSPKQLGEVLFDNMGLEGGKKTKSGTWSTSVDILEKLASQGYEIAAKILKWRELSKLKSTYTDALIKAINPKTGKIHTSFSMAVTNTGRLASSDPNLQNIPIRTKNGRKIRSAFIARDGHSLLSVDYSQVELRLVAELANIKVLKQAFHDNIDIHAMTASQVFAIPLEEITPEIRRRAKAINFGIIYGISGFGLGKQLGISTSEANEYIEKYLSRFPELPEFMEAKKEEARKYGYVRTIYGRKCLIQGINDKNPARRNFAERQAVNAPLQGTAADIIKRAMINIPPALTKHKLNAKMLLQVHDELLFSVPNTELEEAIPIICKIMENSAPNISIPLKVEAGHAQNWADAH